MIKSKGDLVVVSSTLYFMFLIMWAKFYILLVYNYLKYCYEFFLVVIVFQYMLFIVNAKVNYMFP